MKKYKLLLIVTLLITNIFGVSIHDIQYTTNAGDGTYPSNYNGSTTTTGGIVTGVKNNKTFFMESSSGGAWNGIYVYDKNYTVSIGDSLIITGKVYEYHGLTEIKNITNFQKVSSGNTLPPSINISTNNANSNEAYEGVLINVTDITITETPNGFNSWKVNDGSGECTISNDFYNLDVNKYSTDSLENITGIINSSYEYYLLNPRDTNDFEILTQNTNTPDNSNIAIGDTITIIQKPLLNIPFIGTIGDTIEILCLKTEQINNWSANIQFENINYSLEIFNVQQDGDFYNLFATIPETEFYELFDLIVSTGTESDTTKNAVNVIADWKNDYCFVHITDTHLPTHTFSSNSWYDENDSSEIVDLREVINDINIINPEFVLITGDLVNEGELEDYQNRRYYTKSQKLLTEFEVPIFLTSGNHDIGGWESTPPVQGTSRRDWWRFFGWKWLENTTSFYPYHTQNFHFKYGALNFIGLEAYDNYDSFMSDIYGGESFTNDQLTYLNYVLDDIPQNEKTILFYHYDFSNQLNFSTLEINLALWGHIHHDSVNVNSYATEAVCDGKRAYRIIKINSNELYTQNTVHAGDSGENLQITYSPTNDGTANSITATITNSHSISLENCLIKFKMQKNSTYHVTNGNLIQTVESDTYNTCFVTTDLPASRTISVSIKTNNTAINNNTTNNNYYLNINYPNPFNSYTTIEYHIPKEVFVTLKVYNISGELVKTLVNTTQMANTYSIKVNCNDMSSGVYFYKLTAGDFSETKKYTLLK